MSCDTPLPVITQTVMQRVYLGQFFPVLGRLGMAFERTSEQFEIGCR